MSAYSLGNYEEAFEELYEQGYLGDEELGKGNRFLKLSGKFCMKKKTEISSYNKWYLVSIYYFAMSFTIS